jgi:hypothetical protein
MRKDALLLTAGAVLLLMCADAKATEIKLLSHPEISHSDIPTDCPVLVSIMGNGHHYKRVNSYVSASTVIAEATGYSWGKEGEFALCLQVDGWGAARSVFEVLKAMLPKEPRRFGAPTSLSLWGGVRFSNLWQGETYSTFEWK